MKYLDIPELSSLSSDMIMRAHDSVQIDSRIEAYSIKATTADKRLLRKLGTNLEEASSPQFSPEIASLNKSSIIKTKKMLTNFISTLNMSFPDYDYT